MWNKFYLNWIKKKVRRQNDEKRKKFTSFWDGIEQLNNKEE